MLATTNKKHAAMSEQVPLSNNAGPMSQTTINPPARPGPNVRPAFVTVEFKANAFIRSFWLTRLDTMAIRDGMFSPCIMPNINDAVYMCQSDIRFQTVRMPRMKMMPAVSPRLTNRSSRLPQRSASTPPSIINVRLGTPNREVTRSNCDAESVSSRPNHPRTKN